MLSLQPLHGFGIARRIEQVSRGVFMVNPGSLLTALQRLERGGCLDAEWRQTDSGRRARYYRLTRQGRQRAQAETAEWTRRASAIARSAQGRGLRTAMSPWRQFRRGLRTLIRRSRTDAEIAREVEHFPRGGAE